MTSNDMLSVASGVRSVVAKDTGSAMLQVAREIDESAPR